MKIRVQISKGNSIYLPARCIGMWNELFNAPNFEMEEEQLCTILSIQPKYARAIAKTLSTNLAEFGIYVYLIETKFKILQEYSK